MVYQVRRNKMRLCVTGVLLLASVNGAYARNKHSGKDVGHEDGIEVLAHLPLDTAEPITQFLETEQDGAHYLYAEHSGHKRVSVIDISNPSRPSMVFQAELPTKTAETLVAATGTAILVQSGAAANTNAPLSAQTFRIMSFADPQHPVVRQEFKDVTAITSDNKTGLIFLASSDGVWILRQTSAVMKRQEELQKSIEHTIFDTP